MPGWSFFPYLLYFVTVLLKPTTWRLSDIITSNFNLVWCSWWFMYVHHHVMTTCMCAPSRVSSHIHYINSLLRRHFIIFGYSIFPSLHRSMSYPSTISAYDLCISFPFFFVSTLWRHFFVPFSQSCIVWYISLKISPLIVLLSYSFCESKIYKKHSTRVTRFTIAPFWHHEILPLNRCRIVPFKEHNYSLSIIFLPILTTSH